MREAAFVPSEGLSPQHPPAAAAPAAVGMPDERAFTRLFEEYYPRLSAHLQRLTGDPDLAADLAQEALVRLHWRGGAPESVGGWLVSVAMNLLRNVESRRARRHRLLAAYRPEPAGSIDDDILAHEERTRVREALARLAPRDRQLLSLLAGGYRYREMAAALGLHEASVGTLLARAKRAFRESYGAADDAP